MQIGEAARRAGLTVKTVRYYANIGMVTPRQNAVTGYRDYGEDDVAKLQFVGKARRFDFSVEECRELLGLYEDRNRPSREVKALTLKKIAEIDTRLEELHSLKDELSGLASSCDGDHRPDPSRVLQSTGVQNRFDRLFLGRLNKSTGVHNHDIGAVNLRGNTRPVSDEGRHHALGVYRVLVTPQCHQRDARSRPVPLRVELVADRCNVGGDTRPNGLG